MLVDQMSSFLDDVAEVDPSRLTGTEIRQALVAVQKARVALDVLLSRALQQLEVASAGDALPPRGEFEPFPGESCAQADCGQNVMSGVAPRLDSRD